VRPVVTAQRFQAIEEIKAPAPPPPSSDDALDTALGVVFCIACGVGGFIALHWLFG
jgi:hypothetical protein